MKTKLIAAGAGLALAAIATGRASEGWLAVYKGTPYDRPAEIPGRIECENYDRGGEGVAYHDTDAANHGSGELNPANGNPLNEYRQHEGVDISYTKTGGIDDNPFSQPQPAAGSLYVGWTVPGEWLNYTVEVKTAGRYVIALPYTANGDGEISLTLDGDRPLANLAIPSTHHEKETVPWRQWHHWARLEKAASVFLPAGRHVLTLRIEKNGNMNLDRLEFRPADEKER